MEEKGTEKAAKKAADVIADFVKHLGGKASADKPKTSDEAHSSEKQTGGAGGHGGGGAF